MSRRRERLGIVIAFIICACIAACFGLAVCWNFAPAQDEAALIRYIDEKGPVLIELAEKYSGQYVQIDSHGIKGIDARGDEVRYVFSWSGDNIEGGRYIYYADDGEIKNSEYAFTDDAYIDGLGVNKRGYIKCIKLKENWFYIEYCIPT